MQILLVSSLLILLVSLYEPLRAEESFQVVSAFALTIGAGMAALSAIYCFLASAKSILLGPNPSFVLVEQEEQESEHEQTEA
jgi:hypothetical protein